MSVPQKITVVIPNWNGMIWLDECLKSLALQDTQNFHTIFVDNGSTDGSTTFVEQNYPRVEIIKLTSNTGFANAANIGIERSTSPYVILLNTDTQVFSDCLSSLLARIENSSNDIVAISSQILRMADPELIDDAGDELSWYGVTVKRGHNKRAADYQEEKDIFSPCATACLYRRDFLLQAGGFDVTFFAYLEDVDLGLRGRLLGYRYLYLPEAKVLHKGHGSDLPHSRYVELITRNRLLLFVKNIPARLLLRYAAKLLYGQFYFMVIYARPWSSMKGYLKFLAALPGIMAKRRTMMNETALTLNQIEALLDQRAPSPSLRGLVSRSIFKLIGR